MKLSIVEIVEIEAQLPFPNNTHVICMVVHDTITESHPLSEIVGNIYWLKQMFFLLK